MSSIADLLSRIQALEAAVTSLQASSSASPGSAAKPSSVGSATTFPVGPFTYLATPELIASWGSSSPWSPCSSIAWTRYTSVNAPSSANAFVLQVSAKLYSGGGGSPVGEQFIYTAPYAGGPPSVVYGSNSDGTDTDIEGSSGQWVVPAQNGQILYTIPGHLGYYRIYLIGWA